MNHKKKKKIIYHTLNEKMKGLTNLDSFQITILLTSINTVNR